MKFILSLFALLFLIGLPLFTVHATANTNEITAKPAGTTIPLLSPAATELSQQLQSLVSPPSPSVDTSLSGEENLHDIVPNVGTRVLDFVLAAIELVHVQAGTFLTNLAALPQFSAWLTQQYTDTKAIARWQNVGNDFTATIVPAFLVAFLLDILLLPLRIKLRTRKPDNATGKLLVLGTLFLIRAVPIALFVGLAVSLLDKAEAQKLPRFIILNIVYALALTRVILSLMRGILAPQVPTLRIVPVTTKQARYAYRWLFIFCTILIYGYFCMEMGRALHIPELAINALGNIIGLLLVTLTTIVIIQSRRFVAAILRGIVPPMPHDRSWFENLRVGFSRQWHTVAIAYLIIGYVITALDVQNGFILMLRGTILTLIILVATQLVIRTIRQWRDTPTGSLTLHRTLLRSMATLSTWGLAFIGIAAAWGADIQHILNTTLGHRLSGAALSIIMTTATLALIYEGISSAIDRYINRRTSDDLNYVASARERTLLPMLRNTIFFIFATTAIIVTLSQAGVNIGPILAGAGVLGVAIGFGSQTLVKDFLTGLFIVVENTIAIGDIVEIGEHRGVVEAMSIRTLRLRDMESGNLHILPFSEVTSIINLTKSFSYASIKIGIAYDANIDQALQAMRDVGTAMQNDPRYQNEILGDVEVFGVDSLGDYAVNLHGRIVTRAGKQWEIKRAYLQKIKEKFAAEGIEIPFPTVVHIHKDTPPARQN